MKNVSISPAAIFLIPALATAAWSRAGSAEEAIRAILADREIWGADLTGEPGLLDQVCAFSEAIGGGAIEDALRQGTLLFDR